MIRRGLVGLMATAALAVVAIVVTQPWALYSPRATEYSRTADSYHIIVHVSIGVGDPVVSEDVDEGPDAVTVTVRARHRTDLGDFKSSFAVFVPVTITLRDPLGSRRVLDENGHAIPEVKQ